MDADRAIDVSEDSDQAWERVARWSLVATVIWCLIPLSPQLADSDFWGHVQYGVDTWQHGLAETSTYTYTAPGYRWINHENLSELIFAGCCLGLGSGSLLVLKAGLGAAVLLLAIRHNRHQKVSRLPIGLMCVVASVNLSFYWGVRPHFFSFAFFAFLIALTEWAFRGWSGNWHWRLGRPRTTPPDEALPELDWSRIHRLWVLPVFMCLWANTHGGFLAGVAVCAAILGCRAIEYVGYAPRTRWRGGCYLLAIALTSGLATLANPYGLELHRWLLHSLSVPRPEILEWHPPNLWSADAMKIWCMLALGAVGWTFTKAGRDGTRMIVLGLVLYQSLEHQRHLPFFAILLLFWLPRHLDSLLRPLRETPASRTSAWPISLANLTTAGLLILCGLFGYRVATRLDRIEVPTDEYPVEAMQFMADQSLRGRMVVCGHWAQYALGVLGTRNPETMGIQVAFDGRFRTCYPQEIVDMHFDFFLGSDGSWPRYRSPNSPAADPKRILRYREPNLVLANRRQQHALQVMQQSRDEWVLLYEDSLAMLWGRRDLYDDPSKVEFLPAARRHLGVAHRTRMVAWPAAPRPMVMLYVRQDR